jgi:hypothetical protein
MKEKIIFEDKKIGFGASSKSIIGYGYKEETLEKK